MRDDNESIGIIGLTSLFGQSYSFRSRMLKLKKLGYSVSIVDNYDGQRVKQPSFLLFLLKNKKSADLFVEQLDMSVTIDKISEVSTEMKMKGCKKIFIVGVGIGAVYGMYSAAINESISGIVAWYPHLIFPKESKKNPPDLKKVKVPVIMFFGEHDDRVEPGTIIFAKKLASNYSNIKVIVYRNLKHAFADRFIQGFIINPFYNKKAADQSWDETLHWIRVNSNYEK